MNINDIVKSATKSAKRTSKRGEAAVPMPPLQRYLRRPGRLTDAGNAYLVLPVGLLDQLPLDQQEQMVAIATALTTAHPNWANAMTYQVLPWARCRPADLSEDDLAWHGITHDVNPLTGTMGYLRGGEVIADDKVIGHRPTPDPVPTLPGSHPGARPPLLPAPPTRSQNHADVSSSNTLRSARGVRMVETQRRLRLVHQLAPTVDPPWADSIAATDALWGPDQEWHALVTQTTQEAEVAPAPQRTHAPAVPVGLPDARPPATEASARADTAPIGATPPSADGGEAEPTAYDDELAALERELQDLYHPE